MITVTAKNDKFAGEQMSYDRSNGVSVTIDALSARKRRAFFVIFGKIS